MSSSHQTHDEARHPTFKQYVAVALFLFAITLVEFLIIVPKANKGAGWTIAPLAILSIVKFATVIMFYMHLKFDNKLFTWIFLGGLALGAAVTFALVGLFGTFTPSARDFAQANAVAFEHGAEGPSHEAAPVPEPGGPPGPGESSPPGPDGGGAPPPPPPPSGSADLVAQGQEIFTGTGGCGACHTIDGVAAGLIGPDLTHIGTNSETRREGYTGREYITESIRTPEAFAAEGVERATLGLMTAALTANLSDDDVHALVEFLLAQK